jgi:hypothetical protein
MARHSGVYTRGCVPIQPGTYYIIRTNIKKAVEMTLNTALESETLERGVFMIGVHHPVASL